MNDKLDQIITRADDGSNEMHITVSNADTGEQIVRNLNAKMARDQGASSVREWFAKQAKSGINNVAYSYCTKTKSGWNTRRGPFVVRIGTKQTAAPQPQPAAVAPQSAAPVNPSSSIGLSIPGLSFAEQLDLHSDRRDLRKALVELDQIKAEKKEIQEKYDQLKAETDAEDRQQAKLKGYTEIGNMALPVLTTLLEKLPRANPGLGSPDDNLSEIRRIAIQYLRGKEVDEQLANAVYVLIYATLNKKTGFVEAFNKLLETHQSNIYA